MIIQKTENRHLGPRWSWASGKVEITPSRSLYITPNRHLKPIEQEYLVAFVQGLTERFKGCNVKIEILDLVSHPVDSSPMAFIVVADMVHKEYQAALPSEQDGTASAS